MPHPGAPDAGCRRRARRCRRLLLRLLPSTAGRVQGWRLPLLAGGSGGAFCLSPSVAQQACQLIKGQAGPRASVVTAGVELQDAVPRFGRRAEGWRGMSAIL